MLKGSLTNVHFATRGRPKYNAIGGSSDIFEEQLQLVQHGAQLGGSSHYSGAQLDIGKSRVADVFDLLLVNYAVEPPLQVVPGRVGAEHDGRESGLLLVHDALLATDVVARHAAIDMATWIERCLAFAMVSDTTRHELVITTHHRTVVMIRP